MCWIVWVYSLDWRNENLWELSINLLKWNKNRWQDWYWLSALTQSWVIETFKFNDLNNSTKWIIDEVNGHVIAIIWHARYSTSGWWEIWHEYLQPFEFTHLKNGMAFAFNWNIVNAPELAKELEISDNIQFKYPLLDTNVLKHMILSKVKWWETNLKKILEYVNNKIDWACNLVLLSKDWSMAFSKDRWWFRPLAWWVRDWKLYLSSESAALDKVWVHDYEFLKTGRLVEIDGETKKIKEKKMNLKWKNNKSSCFFETVYFADPRTKVKNQSSNLLRYCLWQELANEETELFDNENTIVIDVPKSSFDCAEWFAETLDLTHLNWAITKNPKINRTFISSTEERQEKIKRKYIFNPNLRNIIEWKKIVIIDDSIVRWATMSNLIKDFIEFYNPSEVHIRIPSPPITHPCFYAMNIPTTTELITRHYFKNTNNPTQDELNNLAEYFNSKSVKYITTNWLINALKVDVKKMCLACINGEYPTKWWMIKYLEMVQHK